MAQADSIDYVSQDYYDGCMIERNHRLVESAGLLLAVYNGARRSGTGATIRYAQKLGREIVAIEPVTREISHLCGNIEKFGGMSAMNKFLEMKERGETIRFSDLLEDIPPDGVLRELFSVPGSSFCPSVSHRGMEILKLRLEGFKQSQIAVKLGLTPGQVSNTSAIIKNSLYGERLPYIEVDIPALRKILHLDIPRPTQYACLSELLQAMPSDEELVRLFIEQGNILNGRKSPPTHRDLELIQMRVQGRSYDSIGEETGLGEKEAHHQISLALNRIQRDLKIHLDIPRLRRQ